MSRRLAWVLLPIIALPLAGWLLLGRLDLAPLAARLGGGWLGRPLAIGRLHVTPGRWLVLDLAEARLDNQPGGSTPMARLAGLTAEVDALSILRGPLLVRRLEVRGLHLLLERDSSGRGNWLFGEPGPPRPGETGRATFPTLLDATLRDSGIDYRTRGGRLLRVRMAEAVLAAPDADSPVQLRIEGGYDDAPMALAAALGSYAALREVADPFPTGLTLRSGAAVLRFQGGMTDPLNLDGAQGRLTLDSLDLGSLLRVAGLPPAPGTPALALDGTLEKQGDRWHWSGLTGTLGPAALTGQSLTLVEGLASAPDAVAAVLDFERLDLDRLMRGGGGEDADASLAVDRAPGTLLDLRLTGRRLNYGGLDATDARLTATLRPGQLAVQELSLGYLGGRVTARGQVAQERITADAEAAGMQADALRRLLGLDALPLSGRLDARFALDARGTTLNAAARAAHASAVVRMQGGSIGRRVLELVSTDIRGLFRSAEGRSPVACLLAVVDLRGAEASIAPLRLRAGDGTISGNGSIDLRRRRIDLIVGTEPGTTGALALDVPVRVSGALDDPSIRPASWTAEGRTALNAPGAVARLLPDLRPFARQSPCLGR